MINEKKFLKDYLSQYYLYLLENGYSANYLKQKRKIQISQKRNGNNSISNIDLFQSFVHKISSSGILFNINHFYFERDIDKDTLSQFILKKYFTFNEEEKLFFINNFLKFTQNQRQYAIFLNNIPFEDFKENINSVRINDFPTSEYDLTEFIKQLKTYDISQNDFFNAVKKYVQRRKTSLNKYDKQAIKDILMDNFNSKELTILSKYIHFLLAEKQTDNIVFFEKSIDYISEININLKNLLQYISLDNYNHNIIKNDLLTIIKTIQPNYRYSEYKESTNLKSITQIILMSDYPILIDQIKDDISTLFQLKIKNPKFLITPESIVPVLSAKKLQKDLPINLQNKPKTLKI